METGPLSWSVLAGQLLAWPDTEVQPAGEIPAHRNLNYCPSVCLDFQRFVISGCLADIFPQDKARDKNECGAFKFY